MICNKYTEHDGEQLVEPPPKSARLHHVEILPNQPGSDP